MKASLFARPINDISCRQVDTNAIDKHPALATGMLGAVEVLGFVDQGVEVCVRTTGTLVFLDPITWPPSVIPMPSYSNSAGLTCGQVERVGTVMLVATATEFDSLILLTDCRVTTAQILRLREEVGGERIIVLVPYNIELTASAWMANWFAVSFLGHDVWISAQKVRTGGISE